MEKSGAHRCALGPKFKPGNGDFGDTPPAQHPPFYGAVGGGQRADYSYAFLFFIRQLYETAGLAAALSRLMTQEDDK